MKDATDCVGAYEHHIGWWNRGMHYIGLYSKKLRLDNVGVFLFVPVHDV